jgi:hypothetical protein
MAGLVPAIHAAPFNDMSDIVSDRGGPEKQCSIVAIGSNTWMAGTSPAMTTSEAQACPSNYL